MNLFRDMNARGTTVLVTRHDRELIKWVSRRVIYLKHGTMVERTEARPPLALGLSSRPRPDRTR